MKVKCIANTGKDDPEKFLTSGYSTETTMYELEIQKKYTVYGISLWKDKLNYLIIPERYDVPFWYSCEIFEVIDHLLPLEWYFNYYPNYLDFNLNAIWGYKELAQEEGHYDDLIERSTRAIEIFLRRKKEIDEFS